MSRERVFKYTADGICQQSSCDKPVRQNGFQSRADLHGKSANLKILSVARAIYHKRFKKNRSNLEVETTQENGNEKKKSASKKDNSTGVQVPSLALVFTCEAFKVNN